MQQGKKRVCHCFRADDDTPTDCPKQDEIEEKDWFVHETTNARQKSNGKQVKKETEIYKKSTIDPRAFCILDDCLYDASWTKDKMMRLLFMNGRHWKIMLIITMQYPLGIPPNLRTNIDYVFILREPYIANRKRIYENYAGMFPTFESFCQVMDQCTENYECLVINNNAKSNKLTDQVFLYKAEPHPPFKIGGDQYWKYSEENYTEKPDNNINYQKKNKEKFAVTKLY